MAPPTQTVQQTLADPKFYGLPAGEQQKVLATLDPNYARLPLQERTKVLQMGQQKWGPGAAATPAPAPEATAPTGVLRAPTDRERFLNPDFYPVGAKGEGLGENLKNLAQRGGVGIFQLANAAAHPIDTINSLVASITPQPLLDWGSSHGREGQLKQKQARGEALTSEEQQYLNKASQFENTPSPARAVMDALLTSRGPMELAGKAAPLVGQTLLTEGLGESVPEITSDVKSGIGSVVRSATDTGAGPIRRLVKETQAENEKIGNVNADRIERQQRDQIDADAAHRSDLLKLRQKYEQSVRDAQEKARNGTAADREQYQSKQLAAKQKYEQAVRDATAKHVEARAAAEKANAEAQQAHNRKIGQIARQNRAVDAAESVNKARAAKIQVGGSQLIYGLRQLDPALRDRASTMFDAVREKVGAVTRPGTNLGTAARVALSKISGSSEIPKPFKDILAKYKETEPNELPFTTSTGGTTMVPKGHPIYEVLKSQGVTAPPVTFGDLQGYYSETGAELSKGTLPGDVYQATKELHNAIGDMMQEMANAAGAGKQFWDSRVFYRNYMDVFHEPTGPSGSGSAVAQALLAKDPTTAARFFFGPAGERGVADLRSYSDSLADLAQDIQRTGRIKVPIPRGGRQSAAEISQPKITPIPAGPSLPLPPVLENAPTPRAANVPLPPVLPEPESVPLELKPGRTISSADIQRARDAAAESRREWVNRRGAWVATWPIFEAMRALWGGHIPLIPLIPTMALESAGTFATVRLTSAMMNYPPMIEFLTKARPEDVALIPPELRGDLPGLVSIARRQGIKVAPALIAAAAMTTMTSQKQAPTQPLVQPASTGVAP